MNQNINQAQAPAQAPGQLLAIRNTFALVLAMAIKQVFSDSSFAMGGPSENGFYYDFELSRGISQEDFKGIEKQMKEIIKGNLPLEKLALSKAQALEIMGNSPYQLERIARVLQKNPSASIPCIKIGDFLDLDLSLDLDPDPNQDQDPENPENPRYLKDLKSLNIHGFKLLRASGAYWNNDSSRPMLSRVYGTAWPSASALKDHLEFLEEASKRDHRLIAKQMDLFSFDQSVGQGLPLWHPNGAMVRFLMEGFSQRAHILNGYQWVYTPHIGKAGLWETSGHLDFYKDSMYSPIQIEGEDYYLKPMSCPFHIAIYNSRPRSYRELPIRLSEFAAVYRYELSGALQGLSRVRGFTQDDAHIICMPHQAESEIKRALHFSLYILKAFGFSEFKAYISTKPKEKSIGSDQDWDQAIAVLKAAVEAENLAFDIDEGGGAFYGPKIDLKLQDALGREWQCSTIQFDFNLPARFDMTYINQEGVKAVPLMVHRALFGSVERFFSLLVEHYKGHFPLWLSPIQIGIIPVSDGQLDYAYKLQEEFLSAGLRVEVCDVSQSLKNKIKSMAQKKIPRLIVVGQSEEEAQAISLRHNGESISMSMDQFMASLEPELNQGIPKYI